MAEIGKLRERVVIQTRSDGPGTVTWSNTVTTWAEVKAESVPSESASASAVRSRIQYLVRMRNRTVTATQRLVWNGKTLNINGVRPLDLSYLEVVCIEAS